MTERRKAKLFADIMGTLGVPAETLEILRPAPKKDEAWEKELERRRELIRRERAVRNDNHGRDTR